MRKIALFLALGVLGFVPAAIAFGDDNPSSTSAEQQCRAEQNDASFAASHGGKTFAQLYGTNGNQQNAFGKCVSSKESASSHSTSSTTVSTPSTETVTTTAHVSPASACRAERAKDPAAFKAKYGTRHNKSNAFGRCVSQKAKAQQSND